MRVVVTSDLHFHKPWKGTLELFAKRLKLLDPDIFVIAGDLGEPLPIFELCMKTFQDVCDTRAALAGNHDVWRRESAIGSEELWQTELEQAAQAHDYTWLDRETMAVNGLGICGTIAWYDYSGRHPKVTLDVDEYERLKTMVSNDGNYIDWSYTDREFAAMVADEFDERLQAMHEDPEIDEILVVTHVPVFDGMQRYQDDGSNRIVANAYYANLTLGERIKQYPKVKAVVSGHVHTEHRRVIERDAGEAIKAFTNPSDYGVPAATIVDTETWDVEFMRVTD